MGAADPNGRVRAVDELAAGKLKPPLPGQGHGESEQGKPSKELRKTRRLESGNAAARMRP